MDERERGRKEKEERKERKKGEPKQFIIILCHYLTVSHSNNERSESNIMSFILIWLYGIRITSAVSLTSVLSLILCHYFNLTAWHE